MVGRTVSHSRVVKLFGSGGMGPFIRPKTRSSDRAQVPARRFRPGPAGPRAVPLGSPREEDVFLEAGPGGPACSQIN
ncbi:MAG: hypothetical protein H6Q86_1312 [candidate division NC10 bacterium]|nr:hypothetical protein [candidate division NC10 bacterium]